MIYLPSHIKFWSFLLTGTLEHATSNWISVCTAQSPSSVKIHFKNLQKEQSGAAAADRTPTPKSVTKSPNTKNNNTQELSRSRAKSSLTVCSRTRKRQKYIRICVPQKSVGKPLNTWLLSLPWQLQTWTRGSHPFVHMPPPGASLTWALLLTLFWLSYSCMVLPSA